MNVVGPECNTTLLLNNAWQPITTISAKSSFMHLLRGGIAAMDSKHNLFYSFDLWNREASFYTDQPVLRSTKASWMIPTVIIITSKFFKRPKKKKLNLCEMAKIYEYTCQYCLGKFSLKDLTIDHINPRSKGGGDSHENRTLACRKCNTKKSSHYPWLNINGEIPKAPEIPFLMINKDKIRKEWSNFL